MQQILNGGPLSLNNGQSSLHTGDPRLQGQSPTFQAFFNTVTNGMPEIPPSLHRAIAWFRRLHSYYSRYKLFIALEQARRSGLASQVAVIEGTITILADVSDCVNYALNIAIVTKCVADILKKYRELNTALAELRNAVCYKVTIQPRQQLDNDVHALAISSFPGYDLEITTLFVQALRIAHCALVVLWKTFELSMILEDAYLFFNRDDQTRFVACTDLVAHWRSYSNMVHDELGRILEDNQPVAEQLLLEFGKEQPNSMVQLLIHQLRSGVGTVRTLFDQRPSSSSSSSSSYFSLPFSGDGRFQPPNCRSSDLPGGKFAVQSIRV